MQSFQRSDVEGKSVIIRTDYNVPVVDGLITDTERIDASLETLKACLEFGVKRIVLISHFGKPQGFDPLLTLAPIRDYLASKLDKDISLLPFLSPHELKGKLESSEQQIFMMENIRFYDGETKNDPALGQELSELGDTYIFEAFPSCHNSHASILGIPSHLPSFLGMHCAYELEHLSPLRSTSDALVIVGGKKLESKLTAIKNLCEHQRTVYIGGALFMPLYCHIHELDHMGTYTYNPGLRESVEEILELCMSNQTTLVLPTDVAVENHDSIIRTCDVSEVKDDESVLDIGAFSRIQLLSLIDRFDTIIWNGPMGKFEDEAFSYGTADLINKLSDTTKQVYVGGGDTISLLEKYHIAKDSFTFVSTGGGAFLDYISGVKMPVIDKLVNPSTQLA